MKRIRVEVTIVNEYIVEIDENIYNDEWEEEFSESIHNFNGDRFEGIAKDLVWNQVIGDDVYVEGYGNVSVDGKLPGKSGSRADGLNIITCSEFEDVEYEFEEVKPKTRK